MKCKKIILGIIGSLLAVVLIACSVYTAVYFAQTQTIEDLHKTMAEQSKKGNAEFTQINAIDTFPSYSDAYLIWVPENSDGSSGSEMYLTLRKGWFGRMAVERFTIEEHFSTDERVGTGKCEIVNADNEKENVLLIYSSKEFTTKEDAISNIYVLLKNNKTGEKREIEFNSALGQFAECIELDSLDVEVETIICKNISGEVVYAYEAKA